MRVYHVTTIVALLDRRAAEQAEHAAETVTTTYERCRERAFATVLVTGEPSLCCGLCLLRGSAVHPGARDVAIDEPYRGTSRVLEVDAPRSESLFERG